MNCAHHFCDVRNFSHKSVWVVEVVIVEDVLVLHCERLGWHIHFVYLTRLVQSGSPAAVDQLVEVKDVVFSGLSRKLVVRVLLQIIFAGIEGRQATEL